MANSTNELGTAINTPNATYVCFRYLPTKEEIATVRKAGRHTYLAASTIEGDVADNWRIAAVVGIESILTDYPLAMRRDLYQSSRR